MLQENTEWGSSFLVILLSCPWPRRTHYLGLSGNVCSGVWGDPRVHFHCGLGWLREEQEECSETLVVSFRKAGSRAYTALMMKQTYFISHFYYSGKNSYINSYFSTLNVEIILKVAWTIYNKMLLHALLPDSPVVNNFRMSILETILIPDTEPVFPLHQLSQWCSKFYTKSLPWSRIQFRSPHYI